MVELAHFTPTELPGTLAIWVAGIGLGLALSRRVPRTTVAPLVLIAGFAGLGMLGDAANWSEPARIAIDVAFLAASVSLATALWRSTVAKGGAEPE